MRDLARAVGLRGRPVPVPWPTLGAYLRPRAGNLMLTIAAAGLGKSQFALNWAVQARIPTLYLSLDTSLADQAIRILANQNAVTVDEIEKGHDEDPETWAARRAAELEALELPIRFAEGISTTKEVDEVVIADTEYWGEPPALVIVDNLMDLISEESAGAYRAALGELKQVAKRRDTLVLALHHLRKAPKKKDDDGEEDQKKPPALDDALYAADQHAQYILSLGRPTWNSLVVAVLKNRMGNADRWANVHVTLYADLAKAIVKDPQSLRHPGLAL